LAGGGASTAYYHKIATALIFDDGDFLSFTCVSFSPFPAILQLLALSRTLSDLGLSADLDLFGIECSATQHFIEFALLISIAHLRGEQLRGLWSCVKGRALYSDLSKAKVGLIKLRCKHFSRFFSRNLQKRLSTHLQGRFFFVLPIRRKKDFSPRAYAHKENWRKVPNFGRWMGWLGPLS